MDTSAKPRPCSQGATQVPMRRSPTTRLLVVIQCWHQSRPTLALYNMLHLQLDVMQSTSRGQKPRFQCLERANMLWRPVHNRSEQHCMVLSIESCASSVQGSTTAVMVNAESVLNHMMQDRKKNNAGIKTAIFATLPPPGANRR